MSSISISTRTLAELVVGGLLVLATTWVVRSGTSSSSNESAPGGFDALSADGSASIKSSKSKKKKGKAPAAEERAPTEVAAPPPPAPAQAAQPVPVPASTGSKKKSKAKQTNGSAPAAAPAPAPTPAPAASSPSAAPSFAAIAAPSSTSPPSAQPSPVSPPVVTEAPKTSKIKAAKGTAGTDDMLEREAERSPARVMRVMGGKLGALPPVGDWDDWHSREDEDNGWEVASKKKPSKPVPASTGYAPSSFASSNPAPVQTRDIPGLSAAAQVALTKQQKQNLQKKAREKADKESAEQDRLLRLAQHRRAQEVARREEAERLRNKNAPKDKKSGPRSENFAHKSKPTSGGMKASLDSEGHLIWD